MYMLIGAGVGSTVIGYLIAFKVRLLGCEGQESERVCVCVRVKE